MAVSAAAPAVDTEAPMLRASEDEKASCSSMFGWWARRACLDASLHITPEEMMAMRLDRSQRSGSASRARSIGLAKASPTMAIVLTPSRSTASSSSTASNELPVRVTMPPPVIRVMSAVNQPVPCIRGQAGTCTGPGPVSDRRETVEVEFVAVLRGDGAGVGPEQVVAGAT